MKSRNFIFTLILLLVFASIASAQDTEVYLFPVTQNKKCGYIDKKGKIIIPLQFEDTCYDFSEGLASIGLNGKRGFIDETGRVVIEPRFNLRSAGGFSEGLAAISLDDKKGYVDKSGKVTMLPEFSSVFSSVEAFSEGLAVVGHVSYGGNLNNERNSREGYINKEFELVIPMRFKYASPFSDGRAYVTDRDDASYYIDRTGQKINYPPTGRWFLFVEGLATTELNGKDGYMNLKGEVVIKRRFDEAKRFSHGVAAVRIKNKWGFIDKTGRIVIRPQFDEVEDFGPDGIAAVGKAVKNEVYKYGFINRKGQIVIGFKFDFAGSFWGGLGEIGISEPKENDKWGYVDASGKIIWIPSK
jgi:hypothetical protein